MQTSDRWNIYQQESLENVVNEQDKLSKYVVSEDRFFPAEDRTFTIHSADNISAPIPSYFQVRDGLRGPMYQEPKVEYSDLVIRELPYLDGFINVFDSPSTRHSAITADGVPLDGFYKHRRRLEK